MSGSSHAYIFDFGVTFVQKKLHIETATHKYVYVT